MIQLLAALLLSASPAVAAFGTTALVQQPVRPLPKVGSCPLGYYSSGNDREAIQKTGKGCPLGWFSSGSYCIKSR